MDCRTKSVLPGAREREEVVAPNLNKFEKSLIDEFNFGQFVAGNEVNYFVKPYGLFQSNDRQNAHFLPY